MKKTSQACAVAFLCATTVYSVSATTTASYSCCGNEGDPTNPPCRYTDRQETCTYGSDCDVADYGGCCSQSCVS
jgi:hypothetical protein